VLALHETIRDAGRNLRTLTGNDFTNGLLQGSPGLLTAFRVGQSTTRDARGARVGPVIVAASAPIEDGEVDADPLNEMGLPKRRLEDAREFLHLHFALA